MKNRMTALCVVAAVLLLVMVTACGAEPNATPPPTEVVQAPADTPVPPADTPMPAATPQPTATPAPTPAPADIPAPTPAPVAVFEQAPCPFELPEGQKDVETVECGYLVVSEDRTDPLDWLDPEGRKIGLAVAIFRHPGGDPEPERNLVGDMVQVLGIGTFAGNQEATVELLLIQVDGEWRVGGFRVQ